MALAEMRKPVWGGNLERKMPAIRCPSIPTAKKGASVPHYNRGNMPNSVDKETKVQVERAVAPINRPYTTEVKTDGIKALCICYTALCPTSEGGID